MTITTIINYCTSEYRFIKKSIDSVRPFSDHIIVTFAYNFYDGSEENLDLLKKTFDENSGVKFVDLEYSENRFSNHEWCVYSRIVGYKNVPSDSDYVLFMDADEIVDSNLFVQFITDKDFVYGADYRCDCYWYFRESTFRATQTEMCGFLIYNHDFSIKNVSDYTHDRNSDRNAIYNQIDRLKYDGVRYKNQIMFHHFSWVRTKEEMLKKVSTWGHNRDRNWTQLVEHEFTHDFNGTDFVHRYQYETVKSIV